MILDSLKYRIKLYKTRIKWKNLNKHNYTSLKALTNIDLIKVGVKTYGELNVNSSNNISKLYIGNFCSIASEVLFLLNSEHPLNHISTYPFKVKVLSESSESLSKGDIVVDDDVWIGCNSTIMSGVHIGQGAVIAACSVVTKDVPPYAIVGGVPAKVIKFRFSEEIVKYLLSLEYSLLTEELVKKNIEKMYLDIEHMSLGEVSELYEWIPKKSVVEK
ncbi:CatB-related O-acetyltransferase [Succinivibrio sp. AGMB01872]|uniref:CatB-related O-acetyltransferase n=1 Tax=Succinivibrio faecicola TaxID=2820300 RepID=A0ABS7DGW3_9GAMM|nr:CatB-related O-acetyltransferase [Succinivibrio faecicola]MBW7570536.1 CatB-related O-acetyltransferase [Succinivibrio faecicola]